MNPFLNSSISDEQLMVKYQQGEYMAFEALYYRHKKTVFSYLAKRLSTEDTREEVFQNIFLKFHKSRMNYNQKHPFLKWLYIISRSELYDYCKKKKIQTIPLDESLVACEKSHEKFHSTIIEDLDDLPEKEKQAIKMRYLSDNEYEEISKALDVAKPHARKLVSRGIHRLRAKLMGGQNE